MIFKRKEYNPTKKSHTLTSDLFRKSLKGSRDHKKQKEIDYSSESPCTTRLATVIFVEMLKQGCAITQVEIFEEGHIASLLHRET